jgi:nucleoside-diphosphate-sugar epimerase
MWPERIRTEEELEEVLSRPSARDVESLRALDGDLMILGAGGKMGPSLARRARRALDEAGKANRVIAVSRFSDGAIAERLRSWGIEAVPCDMLAPAALDRLPDAPNVIFMAARKFGSTGNPGLTWATNVLLPGLAAQRYRDSRIVAFSTGNVYPLLPVTSGGATESTAVEPVGEYAQSAMGRERMFEFASQEYGTRVAILRLNYAVELRYGVLVDIARKVLSGTAVDLAMGYVNVIWQGDANSVCLRALEHCDSPPFVLNLTGAETLAVRDLATRFGTPVFEGTEAGTALLSNAALCERLFGEPEISIDQAAVWARGWLEAGGSLLGKPTHFQVRDGRF